jgi:mRNA interferase RelE/StbE
VSYRVLVAPAARRQLTELPRGQLERVDERILALAEDPRPAGAKHLDRDLWRVRAGDFRIVYSIRDEEAAVVVIAVANRKVVYRLLRRMGLL